MKSMLLAASLLAFSGAALAGHCPMDARAIEAGLAKAKLTDEQRSQIEKLKDEGMALHESGDHRGSEKTLAEAMRMLLENMEGAGSS